MQEVSGRERFGWGLMAVVLAIEVLGGISLAGAMIMTALREQGAVGASEFAAEARMMTVGITIVVILSTVWLAVTLFGAMRKRGWVRASNVTIQVLVLAGATGVLQGILGDPLLGGALLVLALVGIVATVLSRPVKPARADGGEASPAA